MLCCVMVAAGVVPDSEDAEASLRDVLAAALDANRELARLTAELRETPPRCNVSRNSPDVVVFNGCMKRAVTALAAMLLAAPLAGAQTAVFNPSSVLNVGSPGGVSWTSPVEIPKVPMLAEARSREAKIWRQKVAMSIRGRA